MNDVSKTIGWADYTWNPITGCLNDCSYCYARKIYERFGRDFTPKIHYDRLKEPYRHKKSLKIFTCSVSDFWGKGVPQKWREEVYWSIKPCHWHIFMILTKQPQNITQEDVDHMPGNVWVGVTVTNFEDRWRVLKLMAWIKNLKFVSVEPLLGGPMSDFIYVTDWIIIGGLTPRPVHEKEWIDDIIKMAAISKKPVYIKENAYYPVERKEWPR